jgi:hypothetical protein
MNNFSTPQPTYELTTPDAGWFKMPAAIGSDPVFLRAPAQMRMACIGMYCASIGWALNHNAQKGWIPEEAILYGQVVAAPSDMVMEVIQSLVTAGLWLPLEMDGIRGYVVAGAALAVQQRFARQSSASKAGTMSRENALRKSERKPRIDANAPVDWSNVEETL